MTNGMQFGMCQAGGVTGEVNWSQAGGVTGEVNWSQSTYTN